VARHVGPHVLDWLRMQDVYVKYGKAPPYQFEHSVYNGNIVDAPYLVDEVPLAWGLGTEGE
jgi:hypothetical protein